MRDKSTSSPLGHDDSEGPGSRPGPPAFNLRRLVSTAALVAAVAVGLSWYFSRRPVEITVVLEFGKSRKNIRSVKVELVQKARVAATVSLDVLSSPPKRHEQRLKVRKGNYVLRTSTIYRDGSRRRSSRKVKVSDRARWVIALH